ncbi:hypothetical protein GCM10009691_05590 [Brevibacterium picturae]|uniref:Uncharacterized protein n=1 Tax=Brevibacterium picturae TaxID=260553 RepID=A0ABN2B2Q3_9MICO
MRHVVRAQFQAGIGGVKEYVICWAEVSSCHFDLYSRRVDSIDKLEKDGFEGAITRAG